MIKRLSRFVLVLSFALLPVVAHAQIAYIGAAYGQFNNNSAISASLDTTGADLLVMAVAYLDASGVITTSDISDSKGNTWTQLTNYSPASDRNVNSAIRLFYSTPTSVGSGHTVTVSSANTIVPSIGFAAFSGTAAASVLDGSTGNAPTPSSAQTTVTTNSLTPSVANTVVVAAASVGDSLSGMAVNGGFTLAGAGIAAGSRFGLQMAYLVQTSAAAANPQFSGSSPDFRSAAIAAFKSSGGGGGSTPCLRLLMGVGCEARAR